MQEKNSADSENSTSPDDGGAPLPHDRDEHPQAPKEDGQHRKNRETVRQAHDDVESGIRDTERIGVPNDVPASGQNRGG